MRGTGPRRLVQVAAVVACAVGAVRAGEPDPMPTQPFVVRADPWPDAVARPTATDGVIDLLPPNQALPDLRTITIGLWQPTNPVEDRFAGEWMLAGEFLRIDLTFDGWLNPPGPIGLE